MARYHVNPDTQRPNICTATGKRGCKYAVDGQEPQHYATKEEAQAAIAAQAKAENNTFTTVSKGKERGVSRRGGVERFKDDFPRKVASMSEGQAVENIASMHAEYTAMVEAEGDVADHVLSYYSFTGSKDINGYLRHGDRNYYDRHNLLREGDMDESGRRCIATLDSLMERYGSGAGVEPRVLYRYIKVPEGDTPESFMEKIAATGKVEDAGYMSATEDPCFLHSHITGRRGVSYIALEILSNRGISLQRKGEQHVGSVAHRAELRAGAATTPGNIPHPRIPG